MFAQHFYRLLCSFRRQCETSIIRIRPQSGIVPGRNILRRFYNMWTFGCDENSRGPPKGVLQSKYLETHSKYCWATRPRPQTIGFFHRYPLILLLNIWCVMGVFHAWEGAMCTERKIKIFSWICFAILLVQCLFSAYFVYLYDFFIDEKGKLCIYFMPEKILYIICFQF